MTSLLSRLVLCVYGVQRRTGSWEVPVLRSVQATNLTTDAVQAAIEAIRATREYSRTPDIAPLSWPSAYILFLSTFTLTAAIRKAGPATKQDIQQHILLGHELMRSMMCPAYGMTDRYVGAIDSTK